MRHGPLGRFQYLQQMLRDELLDLLGVANLFAVHALADALQNLGGGIDADIGGNQRIFHFFENIGVDLFAPGDGVFQAIHQTFAGLLNPRFQTIKQVGFLRDGAE